MSTAVCSTTLSSPKTASSTSSSNHRTTIQARSTETHLARSTQQQLICLITQSSRQGQCREALDFFRQLVNDHDRHAANPTFFSSLETAVFSCTELRAINAGREVHGFLIRRHPSLVHRPRIESSLIRFYSVCGSLDKARRVFDRMLERDVVAWTIMLMAYADHEVEDDDEMWCLLQEMMSVGVVPNRYTVTTMLRCVGLDRGRQVHSQAVKRRRWVSDAFVGSSLLGMYGRNGILSSAQMVFDGIEEKDIVCFNSLISCYGRIGDVKGLLSTFVELGGSVGLAPNQSTYVGLLNACSRLLSLNLTRQVHAHLEVSGHASDRTIQAILLDAYAKCGAMEAARAVFDGMGSEKSIHAWNSIIGGYGKHGHAQQALQIFSQMKEEEYAPPPDYITFTCLLAACAHCGLIHEGLKVYKLMTDHYKIPPRNEHHCCMVDLLGRAGMISEAYEFICGLGCGNVSASVWGSLLHSCKIWGDVEVAVVAVKRLFELESDCSGSYVALASTFAAEGWHDDANSIRELMDQRQIKKDAGCSWIEVGGQVYRFRAGQALDMSIVEAFRNPLENKAPPTYLGIGKSFNSSLTTQKIFSVEGSGHLDQRTFNILQEEGLQ